MSSTAYKNAVILAENANSNLRILANQVTIQSFGSMAAPAPGTPVSAIVSAANNCNILTLSNAFAGFEGNVSVSGTVSAATGSFQTLSTASVAAPGATLSNLTVYGAAATGSLSAGSAAVSGQVSAGSVAAPGATLSNLTVYGATATGSLSAGSATVSGQVSAGSVVAPGASLSNLTVYGATTTGSLSAGSATVSGQVSAGSLSAGSAAVSGSVVAPGASLSNLTVYGATATGSLSAGSAAVSGQVSAGSVAAPGATLSNLTVYGATATGSLSAGSATVSGSVVAPWASLSNLTVYGATTIGSLSAASATVSGQVSAGSLSAGSATVSGQVSAGSLSAGSATVSGQVSAGSVVAPNASLSNATVYGTVSANVIMASNLYVPGTTTTVDALTTVASNLVISNQIGFGPALSVSQKGTGSQYAVAEFFDSDVSTTVPALMVANGGNIGVGTATPAANLELIGTARVNSIMVKPPYGSGLAGVDMQIRNNDLNTQGAGYVMHIGVDANQSAASYINVVSEVGTLGNPSLDLRANGTTYLTMSPTGSVGIGNTNPASTLSVSGGASVGSGYAGTAAPADGLIVSGNVGIGTTIPAASLDINNGIYMRNANISGYIPTILSNYEEYSFLPSSLVSDTGATFGYGGSLTFVRIGRMVQVSGVISLNTFSATATYVEALSSVIPSRFIPSNTNMIWFTRVTDNVSGIGTLQWDGTKFFWQRRSPDFQPSLGSTEYTWFTGTFFNIYNNISYIV